MKRMILFLVCLALAVALGDYWISLRGARMEREARLRNPKPTKTTHRNVQLIPGQVIRRDPSSTDTPQPSGKDEPAEVVAAEGPVDTAPQTRAGAAKRTATKAPKSPKDVQDPIARAALGEVGVSSEAEEYWLAAINDPTLSDHERQDLIEDLNEEGFDDPKNLTVDDLPLIMRRIEIIETYAPDAMDDVNAAAFQEAYKDLVNMFVKVAGL